jgi:hypothetical protein
MLATNVPGLEKKLENMRALRIATTLASFLVVVPRVHLYRGLRI